MGSGPSVDPIVPPAATPPLYVIGTTATPGWLIRARFDTKDGTCVGLTEQPNGTEDLYPMDVCYENHREHLKWFCNADGMLVKQSEYFESGEEVPDNEMCHYGEDKLMFKAGTDGTKVRNPNEGESCRAEGHEKDYKCGGYTDAAPLATQTDIATLQACFDACLAQRDTESEYANQCRNANYQASTKTCTFWNTDGGSKNHCNDHTKTAGWVRLGERWEDIGFLDPCPVDASSTPLAGGWVATTYGDNGGDATECKNSDKKYFVFDLCHMKKHSGGQYEAVYCVSDKVYIGRWNAPSGGADPCSGSPDSGNWEVKAGCHDMIDGGKVVKVYGHWWGKCDAPPTPPPTARPTFPPVADPTANTDTLYNDLAYLGKATKLPGFITQNQGVKGAGCTSDGGATKFHKHNECVLWSHETKDGALDVMWVRIVCDNGVPGYYGGETKALCEASTDAKTITDRCEWPLCSTSSDDPPAAFQLQRWKDDKCTDEVMWNSVTQPLGYCVGTELYVGHVGAEGYWLDGDDIVFGFWEAKNKCTGEPGLKITLKKGVCTKFEYSTGSYVYFKWVGDVHAGPTGNGDEASTSSYIITGLATVAGGLGILL